MSFDWLIQQPVKNMAVCINVFPKQEKSNNNNNNNNNKKTFESVYFQSLTTEVKQT